MTTLDVLRAARARIADEAIDFRLAVETFLDETSIAAHVAYRAVAQRCRPLNLTGFVKHHSRSETVALFDAAIAAEESR